MANLLLKYIIEQRPQYLGIYVAFEPDAYDGFDRNFIGEVGHDQTGRFIPYWVHGESGEGVMEALVDYENEGMVIITRSLKRQIGKRLSIRLFIRSRVMRCC